MPALDEAACSDYNVTLTWPDSHQWGGLIRSWDINNRERYPGGYAAWAEGETDSAMTRATDNVVKMIAQSDPIQKLPDPAVTGLQAYIPTTASFE